MIKVFEDEHERAIARMLLAAIAMHAMMMPRPEDADTVERIASVSVNAADALLARLEGGTDAG